MPTSLEFLFCRKVEYFFRENGIAGIVLEVCQAAIVSGFVRVYFVISID